MGEKKRTFWRRTKDTDQKVEYMPVEEDITVRNSPASEEAQEEEEKTVRVMRPDDMGMKREDREDLTRKLDDMEPWAAGFDPVSVVIGQETEGFGEADRTVSDRKKHFESAAVPFLKPVGWLVCVEGEDFGKSFPLKEGTNTLGRAGNMDVVIAGDRAVSRINHALITYEESERSFLAQTGSAMKPVYVNDEIALLPMQMKARDLLCVGDTTLMLIPCCDESFSWDSLERKKIEGNEK
ncbi:MAG: FHA domain-containing protein [Lachnospiraceae bacterium]|nr:FHA domain-containing protein [Lachnospiraceae bacterium]